MAELKTRFKTLAGEYNFDNDPGAGAIGNRNLGVAIPKFSWIFGFWVTALFDVLPAGSNLSFGTITTDLSVPVAVANNLMVATPAPAFTAQPLAGVDLRANPLRTLNDLNVIMGISTLPLTQGIVEFVIWFNELDK